METVKTMSAMDAEKMTMETTMRRRRRTYLWRMRSRASAETLRRRDEGYAEVPVRCVNAKKKTPSEEKPPKKAQRSRKKAHEKNTITR